MIQQTMFVLAVLDLERSAEYYKSVLGFSIREIGDSGWRIFVKDNCRIMAGHCPDAIAPRDLGDHSYFAYFTVEDVDDYHNEVTLNGAEIIKSLRSEPWGMREFALRTVDGHRIMVGQDISES